MDDQHPNAERAYTRKQWKRAVNLSAVLGWLSIAVPISAGMNSAGLLQFFNILIWAAAIGLPIAFIASWLIAAPILNRLMRKNISWFQAVIWGGAIMFLAALASIAIGLVTLSCRSKCSFKPPSVRKRPGLSSPVLSDGVVDCRTR